jgi:hypothetical protein
MDFELTDEMKMLRDMTYKFAVAEFTPTISHECDKEEKYTPEIVKKAAENGLVGAWVPEQYGGAGDFDLMTSWTAVGRGTENPGRVMFTIEDRFEIGGRTPNSLGGQIATLQPTANTFNDRGWVIRDAFWEQRLIDGQFRFLFGRADLTDYFGSTWMQNANNSFVNRMFASNPTIAAPGHGPAAGVSYRPKDYDFYLSAGTANAYGTTSL